MQKMKSLINRKKGNKTKVTATVDSSNLVDKEKDKEAAKSQSGSSSLLNARQDEEETSLTTSKEASGLDMINKMLPKELLIRVFSHLDVKSLCRSAQVCKYWNELALDGVNWQYIDLFDFQIDISETVLENIGRKCHEFLKGLRLENCRTINDDAIRQIARYCTNIQFLNLKQCIKLTNGAFNEIGAQLNRLVYLNLESCCITDEGLVKIGKGCPGLVSIDVSYCKSISSEALKKFAGSCKNLKYFSSKGVLSVRMNFFREIENRNIFLRIPIQSCQKLNLTDQLGKISLRFHFEREGKMVCGHHLSNDTLLRRKTKRYAVFNLGYYDNIKWNYYD